MQEEEMGGTDLCEEGLHAGLAGQGLERVGLGLDGRRGLVGLRWRGIGWLLVRLLRVGLLGRWWCIPVQAVRGREGGLSERGVRRLKERAGEGC